MSSKKNKILKSGQDVTSTPGFFRRLAAQIYDTFLLIAILILANGFLYLLATGELIRDYQLVQRIYLVTISFLFYGWFWTHGGQTLGLRAWKIKVLTLDQKPISWKHALLRFTTAIFSWGFLGLGFLWVLLNKNGYSWHDYLSKTTLFFEPKK